MGVILTAGAVYMGVSGRGEDMIKHNDRKANTSGSDAASGDSNYVNTQWNDAVGGTSGMPENWPKDAPVAYSGAVLMSSLSKNAGTGKSDPSVVYFSSAPVKEIIDYYIKSIDTNAWKVESNADSPAGYRVITAKKDDRTFYAYISITQIDGKTGVTSGVNF